MSGKKTKLESMEDFIKVKKAELVEVEQFREAKSAQGSAAWMKMLKFRLDCAGRSLVELDSTNPEFRSLYDKNQAVRDEYLLLLSLLADPDKRAEKVTSEIEAKAEEVKRFKSSGETSGQY
jgi:hypothetical protein